MSNERLRPAPSERFAGEQHLFDFKALARELRAEAHEGQRGHRQKTLFQRAPSTLVLFAFEAGGELADHRTDGLVTIQVIEGALRVEAEGHVHELSEGMALVLRPKVPHNVRAEGAATMLLNVILEDDSRSKT